MQQPVHTAPVKDDDDFSLNSQWKKILRSIAYALSHWKILLVAAIAGALLMIGYSCWKPVTYTARTTFVVEESKLGGGGSLMAAMAGQFGFDIGSMGGGTGGVLSGDNVLELLKSHTLIRKTLLTFYDSVAGKTLADEYAEVSGWKEKWQKSGKVGKWINFKADGKQGRMEDSLMQKMIKRIVEEDMSITKPDRKLSFFEMTATMHDEKLTLLFSQRLLKTSADFYIDTKTKRLSNNVNRLQAKADSLAYALNRKTSSAADANRLLLDANPVYSGAEVTAEISSRDKIMQGTIYAEIVKNLEMSKTALMQETPTFQVVDDPEVPLKDNKMPLMIAIITGAIIALVLAVIGIILLRKNQPAL